jgi:hypothetical protein
LLKDGVSLAEVGWHYGKNVLSISSTVWSSVRLENLWFFLSGILLGTKKGTKGLL